MSARSVVEGGDESLILSDLNPNARCLKNFLVGTDWDADQDHTDLFSFE